MEEQAVDHIKTSNKCRTNVSADASAAKQASVTTSHKPRDMLPCSGVTQWRCRLHLSICGTTGVRNGGLL